MSQRNSRQLTACWCFEKRRQRHVDVFLQNRNGFWTKWTLKRLIGKDSLPRSIFRRTKPMLLCFKNYGFIAQNLWSCSSKSMFLQPESIGFVCKHLIGLFEKNQKSLYSFVNQEIVKGASKLVCFATSRPSVNYIARMRAWNSDFPWQFMHESCKYLASLFCCSDILCIFAAK